MPVELWGASNNIDLMLPSSWPGFVLLLLYTVALAYILFAFRHQIRPLASTQSAWLGGLVVAGLIASQLLPFKLSVNIPPTNGVPVVALTLLASIPFLLAAVILNPLAALLVGLATGLGHSLGHTHTLFDLFNMAFTAVTGAILLQQNYNGRLYHWLREPVIVGVLAGLMITFLTGLTTFAAADGLGLAALDRALATAGAAFWPRLIEGLLGGAVVTFILRNLPTIQPKRALLPSPARRSLQMRLTRNYISFAALLIVLSFSVVYLLSINVSTRYVINQMAFNAGTVSAEVPAFRTELQSLVELIGEDDNALMGDDPDESTKALGRIYRINPSRYRRILLVDNSGSLTAVYPPPENGESIGLTDVEATAVTNAFDASKSWITPAETLNEEQILSFIVPVVAEDGVTEAVLVGRVPELSTRNLIIGLQGAAGEGTGFIVNEEGKIIAHPDSDQLLDFWPQEAHYLQPIRAGNIENGQAYKGWQIDGSGRELVYAQAGAADPWTVVTAVPYTVVLDQAWRTGWPLLLVLVIGTVAFFFTNVAVLGPDITRPITEIVEASRTMAAGGDWTPFHHIQREDEIGQLNQAFIQMQRAMRKRLNELSLLLGVSHDVSTSIDINQGLPAILRGALRGTGAAGARVVVLNPSGGNPLTFGEGPAAKSMATLDRHIMTKLRHNSELMLATPNQIRGALELDRSFRPPIPCLLAIPLRSHDRFQGILWLGYRQAHSYDLTERNLLATLATQAAVLVENARLYSTAEGGRRRLAAVLASTSDAVIVTDQTERVLLINRAAERLFDLRASQVSGRPIADVIEFEKLVDALTGQEDHPRNIEVLTEDGRTFYASASTIVSNEGQTFGRVAVLRDITHLKEMDEMKSDFVATVSHDLRSPLTFMRGYATMLPMVGELNEKQQDYADKILNGIDQMTQLVNDLLDLGRIEAGVDLERNTISVKPLLTDIAEEYWQHAHLAGIKLEVEVGTDVSTVEGDSSLIRQALANLVGNAIKYAPDSGHMVLGAIQANGEVIFSVQDNGPGISKQDQMRLFEKFYRVKQRGTEKVKGSGLGLAIVRSIAERHGGRAWCESQRGKGCTFFIAVPHDGHAGQVTNEKQPVRNGTSTPG